MADNKFQTPIPPPGFALDVKAGCPNCGKMGIVKINKQFHCNYCQKDWTEKGFELQSSPTRKQMNSGWKQPKIGKSGIIT